LQECKGALLLSRKVGNTKDWMIKEIFGTLRYLKVLRKTGEEVATRSNDAIISLFTCIISYLPETCYCEFANWPPVEPDPNSVRPRTKVASCIPVRRAARLHFESVRPPRCRTFPSRKLFAMTNARLPPARPAGRPGCSDCSTPASVAVLACKVLLHLREERRD